MPVIIAAHAAAPQIYRLIFRYGLVRAGVPFVLLAHTCHVADNLQAGAMRGAEKLESKSSSYVELKPNKFKKRADLKTGRYRTERTRQGIVNSY